MSVFVTTTQKKIFSSLIENEIDFEYIENLFILMNIDMSLIYQVAIEIRSKILFDLALYKKIKCDINPSLSVINTNDIELFEHVQRIFMWSENRCFEYAIKNNNTVFISYFANKTDNCVAPLLCAITTSITRSNPVIKILLDKIKLMNNIASQHLIIDMIIESKSLFCLEMVLKAGFEFGPNSLKLAVETSDINIVEFILRRGITTNLTPYNLSFSNNIAVLLTTYNVSYIKNN